MESQTPKPVKIARVKPCNCGCKGRDPWHAKTFHRVVRNIVEVSVKIEDPTRCQNYVIAKGEVQMPWGVQEVVLSTYNIGDKLSSYRIWEFNR